MQGTSKQIAKALQGFGQIPFPKERLASEPPWLSAEEYPDMVSDIATDLVISHYWRLVDETEKKLKAAKAPEMDDALRQQLLNEATMKAAQQATLLESTADRATYALLWKINSSNLHLTARDEYETFEEFLRDRIPDIAQKSMLSDTLFLLQKLIPILNGMDKNWSAKELLKLKDHWSKTRAAIPVLRRFVNMVEDAHQARKDRLADLEKKKTKLMYTQRTTQDVGEKEEIETELEELEETIEEAEKETKEQVEAVEEVFAEKMHKAITLISNPDIPVAGEDGIKAVLARNGGHPEDDFVKFSGTQHLHKGKTLFVLEVPDRYSNAVQNALRNLATFGTADIAAVLDDLSKKYLPKTTKEVN